MLKRFLLSLLFVCPLFAQSTTPYIGLQLPAHGALNWDAALNANFLTLDALLGGASQLSFLQLGSVTIGTNTSQPACSSSNRGQLWFVEGTGGGADELQQCINNGVSGYAWQAVGAGTGGGGGGGSVSVQFSPTYSTSLAFGSCSGSSPCYLAPNGIMQTYTSIPTVTPASGTNNDTLWVYGIPTSNLIQVGYNTANTYTCAGCTLVPSISAIPSNAYGLYQCTVTAGVIQNNGCTPVSTQYSNSSLGSGLGVSAVKDPTTGAITINTDRTVRYVTSGTSDTILATDCGNTVSYSSSSAITAQLAQAGLGSQFLNGCDILFVNSGQQVTVDMNGTSKFNATQTSFVMAAATPSTPTGAYVTSDGSNYTGILTGGGGASGCPLSGCTYTGPLTLNAAQPEITVGGGSSSGSSYIQMNNDIATGFGFGVGGSANPNNQVNKAFIFHSTTAYFNVDTSGNAFATGGITAGGSLNSAANAVTFSATPAFDLSKGNLQTITLTGNVTSSSVSNAKVGEIVVFHICQDATGGHTFAAPSVFKAFTAISATANKCSEEMLETPDATNFYLISANVTGQ